jgi:outer membrane protein, multidrug efflux system
MPRQILIAGLLFALSACAVGPDYERPETATDDRYTRLSEGLSDAAPQEQAFWQGFGDPLLAQLVADALADNHDLRVAAARYEQSRALLRGARHEQLPDVRARGFAGDHRASADQMPGVDRDGRDARTYEAGVQASWELDLFGRVRREVEARRDDAAASAADLAAARVAIVAELAGAYYELRGQQARLQVAIENAANQRNTLELVTVRADAGRGTELDAARARAQLEATLSLIPALEADIAAATHRIAVLAGQPPAALADALEAAAPAPPPPAAGAGGAPGGARRRRPPPPAAHPPAAAPTARIGVATGDLYPRFTLGALVGSQAARSSDLFARDSETRLVGLGIDWTFLNAGRVRARIATAEANAQEHLIRYQQTVLLAVEEAETAMVRYARIQRQAAHLGTAADAGEHAARLARLRYEGGIADFLQVLDAERARLEMQDRLEQSRTRAAVAMVDLYRALAGAWDEPSDPEPSEPGPLASASRD